MYIDINSHSQLATKLNKDVLPALCLGALGSSEKTFSLDS